jgi:amino acid transporter
MLTVPRLSMAMAERGHFPAFLARVHPVYRTPWVSVLVYAGVAWILANQAGLLQNLSLSAVSRLFIYGLVCAALPVLRRKESGKESGLGAAAFRAPGGTALAVIGVAGSLVLAARMSVREAVTMAILIALASAHWFVVGRRQAALPHHSLPHVSS